jgi:hypothetical protein
VLIASKAVGLYQKVSKAEAVARVLLATSANGIIKSPNRIWPEINVFCTFF